MTHVVDELLAAADAAIADMREAALRARALHAHAELMRHMRGTAAKLAHLPLEQAGDKVASEWMDAWHLDGAAYPDLAADIRSFTLAFVRDAAIPGPASEAALRHAITALDAAFARIGTSIADQMAFRSQCAHAWWEAVVPVPPDLPERKIVPRLTAGAPFWETGCAERCR